jgi:hypothetical protein
MVSAASAGAFVAHDLAEFVEEATLGIRPFERFLATTLDSSASNTNNDDSSSTTKTKTKTNAASGSSKKQRSTYVLTGAIVGVLVVSASFDRNRARLLLAGTLAMTCDF